MANTIKKITRKDGSTRYRFVLDIGRDPATGKRQQITRTFDLRREAEAEYSRIRNEVNQQTYVRPSKLTLSDYLDGWVEGATRELKASSKVNYRGALKPVIERLGAREIQSITKADIEKLVTFMLTQGRRRGGKAGTGLSGRSVQLTLGRLTAALEMAVAEGILVRNPAKLVRPPSHKPAERGTWTVEQVRAFLATAGKERLHAAWRLSMYGLRRGEVIGLRWQDVDLKAKTITINQSRVLVDYQVRIEEPKSRNGFRTLPIDDTLHAALMTLQARQSDEKEAAESAYSDSGYVVVDELGKPVHPERYSDDFARVLKRAGVPKITLHDGRGSSLSLLEKAGVPISVISKWAGHHDPAFTYKKYIRTTSEDLQAGSETFGKLYQLD